MSNDVNNTFVKGVSKKQFVIYNWFRMPQFENYRHLIAHGAMRTGKTVFTGYGFFDWTEETSLNTPRDKQIIHWNNFNAISTTKDNAHDNIIQPIMEHMRTRRNYMQVHKYKDLVYKRCFYNSYDRGVLMVRRNGIIWRIKYFGVNNKRAVITFQGRTSRGSLLDESPTYGIDLREKIISRHMTFPDYRIFETGNPEGDDSHPYYENVIRNGDDKGYLVINFQMLDNPIFTTDDVAYFKKIYTTEMFRKNVLGQWVRGTGMIYKSFHQEKHVFNLWETARNSDYNTLNIGVDYGEKDATAFVLNGIRHQYLGVDFLKEYYHKNGVTTPDDMEEQYRDTFDNGEKSITEYLEDFFIFAFDIKDKLRKKHIVAYFESATHGQTFYKLVKKRIKQQGIGWITARLVDKSPQLKGKSGIKERINTMNLMLGADFVRIDKRCKQFQLGLKRAAWHEDKEERLDDQTSNIDIMDAGEYSYIHETRNIHNRLERGVSA